MNAPSISPSEALIIRRFQEEIREGVDPGTALLRTANLLEIDKRRVLKVWIRHCVSEA